VKAKIDAAAAQMLMNSGVVNLVAVTIPQRRKRMQVLMGSCMKKRKTDGGRHGGEAVPAGGTVITNGPVVHGKRVAVMVGRVFPRLLGT
jgi:hypothetical protein